MFNGKNMSLFKNESQNVSIMLFYTIYVDRSQNAGRSFEGPRVYSVGNIIYLSLSKSFRRNTKSR